MYTRHKAAEKITRSCEIANGNDDMIWYHRITFYNDLLDLVVKETIRIDDAPFRIK
jgi:hypothetical protein